MYIPLLSLSVSWLYLQIANKKKTTTQQQKLNSVASHVSLGRHYPRRQSMKALKDLLTYELLRLLPGLYHLSPGNYHTDLKNSGETNGTLCRLSWS